MQCVIVDTRTPFIGVTREGLAVLLNEYSFYPKEMVTYNADCPLRDQEIGVLHVEGGNVRVFMLPEEEEETP